MMMTTMFNFGVRIQCASKTEIALRVAPAVTGNSGSEMKRARVSHFVQGKSREKA